MTVQGELKRRRAAKSGAIERSGLAAARAGHGAIALALALMAMLSTYSLAGAEGDAPREAASPASPEERTVGCVFLSCSAVRSALASARAASTDGRYAEALGYCNAVGDSKKRVPDKYRLEARYLSGMILFSTDPGVRDLEAGRSRIAEIAELDPTSSYLAGLRIADENAGIAEERRVQAEKLQEDFLALQEQCHREKDDLRAEVEQQEGRCNSLGQEMSKCDEERSAAARRIKECEEANKTLQAQIEEKDKALKGVKRALTRPKTEK